MICRILFRKGEKLGSRFFRILYRVAHKNHRKGKGEGFFFSGLPSQILDGSFSKPKFHANKVRVLFALDSFAFLFSSSSNEMVRGVPENLFLFNTKNQPKPFCLPYPKVRTKQNVQGMSAPSSSFCVIIAMCQTLGIAF